MSLETQIKEKAFELGFDLAGITTATPLDEKTITNLRNWLEAGCAGEMEYLKRNFDKRVNPALLLKNAKSVICLGFVYRPAPQNHPNTPDQKLGRIANYALYPDYHPYLKAKLFQLAEFIQSQISEKLKIKACVDSVPIAERSFSKRAGLGFIGKNSMLINPDQGSQFFLAELITTLELKPDAPLPGSCGSCTKCIDACPTNALSENNGLDASKCINYLTIEHKSPIPKDIASKIDANLYGCDRCVQVCPYEASKKTANKLDFKPDKTPQYLDLKHIADMDETSFKKQFAHTAIERIGLEKLKANAQICLENIATNSKT